MTEVNICPCCGRHCDLNDPHCERGREYTETGVIPERAERMAEGRHHSEDTGRRERHAHGRSENKRRQYRRERYENADTNDRIVINLRELGHKIRYRFEGKGSQERVLCILKEKGDITQRELTERLGIKPGSASELLAKLENAGMILRTPNDDDHRMVNISLTESGREQANKADGLREKKQEAMFACLTDEEKEMLLGLLEKLNRGWEFQDTEKGHDGEWRRHHRGGGHHSGTGYHSGTGHHREQDLQE